MITKKWAGLCALATMFSLITYSTTAQNYSIYGQVIDSTGAEVYAGNVVVRNVQDSTVITGTYFYDGVFRIDSLTAKNFIVQVSSYGYVNTYININKTEPGDIDLGNVQMNVLELEGVTVVGFRDRITQARDRITVDIASTMLSSGNSIMDVLANTPNVLVTDDQVSVFGRGTPLFYLNNQQVSLETLKTIPVSEIKDIEVITNPSARFEADANAVIRVVTKSFISEGVQVNLRQNLRQGFGFQSYSEAGVNYRKGKWNLQANYNFDIGDSKKKDEYTRTAAFGQETFLSAANTNTDISNNGTSAYLVGVSYDLNEKNTIAAQWNGKLGNSDYRLNTNNNVQLGTLSQYDIRSESAIDPSALFLNRLNLNYTSTLDTLGSNLFVGAQYSNQADNYTNVLKESLNDGANPLWQKQLFYDGIIDIYTGRIDFEKKFAKGGTLRLGTKGSSVDHTNESSFELRENDNSAWISSPDFTSTLNYNENYFAGYAEYGRSFGKTAITAGLRSEYTESKVSSGGTNVLYDTTYLNLFPSLEVKRGNLSLSYGMKINRVPFDYLNAVSVYIDSFSVSQGNPLLLPTFYNSFDLNYMNLVTLGYSKVTNEVQQFFVQDEVNNRTIITFDNVSSQDRFTGSLILPVPSKKFVSYVVTGCNYTVSRDARFVNSGIKAKPQFYVYGYGSFDIKDWFTFQFIGQYISGSSNGISSLEPFGNVDLSISRKFFKDQLSCEIYAGDIFRTTIYRGTQYSQTADATFNVISDTRFVRLGLKYNFGRLKKPNYSIDEVGKDETDRAKTDAGQ